VFDTQDKHRAIGMKSPKRNTAGESGCMVVFPGIYAKTAKGIPLSVEACPFFSGIEI